MTRAPASYDAVILGAGAAGLYAAGIAAQRGLSVLLLDHARAPGEKIRISGGGRCNFTNVNTGPQAFLSENPHFAKSALARHTAQDFIALIRRHGIAYHEKTLGQLFCDGSARQVVTMLVAELAGAELRLSTPVGEITHADNRFALSLAGGRVETPNLVVATGGRSIPKMGASGFGYQIAERFGIALTETRPGLVPLTFGPGDLAWMSPLSGVALPVTANSTARRRRASFAEAALFTHRGLSGPAVLQISSYWREGEQIALCLLPEALSFLRARKAEAGRRALATVLAEKLPARLAQSLAERHGRAAPLAEYADAELTALASLLSAYPLKPIGSEGYRTAEVTLGGVSTAALDARTMAAKPLPGLHFIGEVVDVTGWLGGYNFQWAWSSAHACAMGLNGAG
ncbi:NAD(P)/FAD-dependent oxidoreductase [Frigidibacter sp. ROC022]|uniref:NAD(P)/FAD-dependent oxidoreductase n=1 Tax=Frigidibacter sp. ROC022 TaxID=2971796 RepID=UPI00215B5C10|nr:NAD(P)/FAD-dependent oxidoreductase [Frigidibacter sp. ROC022]MCR8723786.1 NAD(P)/FAD-dependent oxidoreductase [Frigidibacter sp. ROC022]